MKTINNHDETASYLAIKANISLAMARVDFVPAVITQLKPEN